VKNIHVLPTDKPSRLHTYKGVLNLAADEFVAPTIVKNDLINLNIYITSDEEIKERDWCVDTYKLKNNHNPIFKWNDKFKVDAKKIILTTDQDLIKDGVQTIDDEFLEWFVKNPSCEWVEVETKQHFEADKSKRRNPLNGVYYSYKIIIPQEEPKQENCCTPLGQIKRYVDCVGCDKKPKQMSKQTAVEYLIEVLRVNAGIRVSKQLQEEVLQMEKEQIIDAASDHCYPTRELATIDAQQYYNETYKKDK
jgi:hypothetical protein